MSLSSFESAVIRALNAQDYAAALDSYNSWYDAVISRGESVNLVWRSQHKANAANLSRKALYDSLGSVVHCSTRLKKAVDMFVGLTPKVFALANQQPSFFYVPDLTAQPFWPVELLSGLGTLADNLAASLLGHFEHSSTESYLTRFDNIPQQDDWQKLYTDWQSVQLMIGGEAQPILKTLPSTFSSFLDDPLIAQCPPFAPEAFVSTLVPKAVIPPHYGLTNIKLTLHVALNVNPNASLTAGGQVFHWHDGCSAMVFDDSFLHSAKNEGEVPRSVLILDIWHPDLTLGERNALARFFDVHHQWKQGVGRLSGLDKGL
ncbi:aspartyl/asparaginyl beta-hydroxylase domain-containing protein [Alteromonas oceanisediminis]|uniref:aspartyl/asparaginyl beta-hydroxylase domain-containing protein n=1 Tax=Alteromonas oceanisediminis TaxID=2836180 RepID=UPI001BDB63BC|nr:aspartyl/asparaginyl beta-hydroxylase domain-containing protein [Alteromonas oceanisediminis]MBT0584860.1 aspartyl/asparaginyl beta-hydroxylase domain-containing protein [Alteromonas oceanisediminis]